MKETATALVQTGPEAFEFQEIPLPTLQPGELLIHVEANGLCHTDVDEYHGLDTLSAGKPDRFPRILGHEIVGTIEAMGPITPDREGLKLGDRVGVSPFSACGTCNACKHDKPTRCQVTGRWTNNYGFIPLTEGPGLWGGYATHAYVPHLTRVYPFPESVHPYDATQWNMLAGGIQWAVLDTGMKPGDKVAILGCGQRGLACIAAAKNAGAGLILTTGLTKDQHKLRLAKDLGADHAVDVEAADLLSFASEATDGMGFDIIIDTSPHSFAPIRQAIDILRPGGKLMLVGLKTKDMDGFPVDKVVRKQIQITGCYGQGSRSYELAAGHIADGTISLSLLRTHVLGIDQLDRAVELLEGRIPGEHAINIVLVPQGRDQTLVK